jgi:hypothetical protein
VVVVSVVFIPRGAGERLDLTIERAVPVRGAAAGVQVVGLVEFPDLVAQGVLDGVAALFT